MADECDFYFMNLVLDTLIGTPFSLHDLGVAGNESRSLRRASNDLPAAGAV